MIWAVIGLSASAQAQTLNPTAKPFAVRVGYLLSNDVSNQRGDFETTRNDPYRFFSLGASYDLPVTPSGAPTKVSVYLDYFLPTTRQQNRRDTFGTSDRIRLQTQSVGAGVAIQTGAKTSGPIYRVYTGVGAGFYYTHTRTELNRSVNVLPMPYYNRITRTTKAQFGASGKLFIGAESAAGVFGELEYVSLPSVNPRDYDDILSGPHLRLGYRF